MLDLKRHRAVAACCVCFLVGCVFGARGTSTLLAQPTPKPADAVPFPMSARIGANLYLQTTAEYRACCLGIYRAAARQLETTLKAAAGKWSRPAVIMDLDETVLDNSAFETFLYQNNLEYSDQLWSDYEENYPQDVSLIPGAKQFIDRAEGLGAQVVYISNRTETFRKSTISAMERLGINMSKSADRLYLKTASGTSDKSARREAATTKFNVLMYFGDNLRDFSEAFAAKKLPSDAAPADLLQAIQERAALAEAAAIHWGVDWYVLPNPVYGEWEKLIGQDPRALFHPTSMKGK